MSETKLKWIKAGDSLINLDQVAAIKHYTPTEKTNWDVSSSVSFLAATGLYLHTVYFDSKEQLDDYLSYLQTLLQAKTEEGTPNNTVTDPLPPW